jgi:glycosyltransferase involved in cell wall biosynthesis
MRIFFDGFIYDFQQFGGINRYFNEIIKRLPAEDTPSVSTYLGRREFWPSHPRLKVVRSRPFARAPALAFAGQMWLKAQTTSARADLFHPTYYQLLDQSISKRRPLVITVHDMIHEIFRPQANLSEEVRIAKRSLVERADAILCNSEHTRQDLIRYYPLAEPKCSVTPLASSIVVDLASAEAEKGLERPFFLYVGGRESYKNFGVMLDAWAQFSALHPEHLLRVVGGSWRPEESHRITELGLQKSVVLHKNVDDAKLAILYHRSIALVYPSLYEGFGIPPLEAMRCHTAVICSNSSSLPEVGGDAPLYFDPRKSEELCAQMTRLAESSTLRTTCLSRGALRAQLFSWEQTAALTHKVYRSLLGK